MKVTRTVYIGVAPVVAPLAELAPEMALQAQPGADEGDLPRHGLMFVHPGPETMEAVIVALSDNGLAELKKALAAGVLVATPADLERETRGL